MIQDMTITQVATRLEHLEQEVHTMKAALLPETSLPQFEFVIYVDDHEMWSGIDVPIHYPEILRQYPKARISIGWRSAPVVLI